MLNEPVVFESWRFTVFCLFVCLFVCFVFCCCCFFVLFFVVVFFFVFFFVVFFLLLFFVVFLLGFFYRVREKTEVTNRPAHLRSAVWIIAARVVSDWDYLDGLTKTKIIIVYSNNENYPDLQMGLGLRCLRMRL